MSSATRFARYRLRSLLILTTVVAIILGIARLRPSSVIAVDVHADGSVAIAGRQVPPQALQHRLESELARRRRWLMDGTVVVEVDRDASFKAFKAVIENAGMAGSSKVSITAKNSSPPAARP
jgi:biopolymer transport protein ExbD